MILLAPAKFRLRDREPSQPDNDILQRVPRADGHDGDSERSFAPRMKKDGLEANGRKKPALLFTSAPKQSRMLG